MFTTDTNPQISVADWYDRYAIGIPEIDSRYQDLFFLFNTESDTFIDYASANDLPTVFDDLIDYARFQFFAEECWMQHHQFPRLQRHENEHGNMLNRASNIYEEFSEGAWSLSLDILEAIHLWLKTHILLSHEEIDDFIAINKKCNTPLSCEYKKKMPDTTRKALHAWQVYSNRTAISSLSSPLCIEKTALNNGAIACSQNYS